MSDTERLDGLTSLVKRVENAGEGSRVAVADVIHAIGDDAFPPLLIVPALVLVSPISGIPGMSTLLGLVMMLIALQMVFRRRHVWLPGFLMRRTIGKARLKKAMDSLTKPAGFVDRVTGRRLAYLVHGPLKTVPAVICLLAAMTMPLLEVVPFSSSIVSAAIVMFALSILVEDGLLFLFGLVILASGGYVIWSFLG